MTSSLLTSDLEREKVVVLRHIAAGRLRPAQIFALDKLQCPLVLHISIFVARCPTFRELSGVRLAASPASDDPGLYAPFVTDLGPVKQR